MSDIADQIERQQALDPTKSFIVQAPAGSGKTELLTQRYLTLLAQANDPEEIVAITFTRKAAAEMRARIIEALHFAQHSPMPEQAHARLRWELAQAVLRQNELAQWQLLENPNRLRIQTIDAFCAYLTRQIPILSRFGAQPDIINDPYILYREAAQTILNTLETDVPWAQSLITLLLHLDNDQQKVENLLSAMLARRDQWLSHIASQSQHDNLRAVLEKGIQRAITDTLRNLRHSIPSELSHELYSVANFAAEQLIDNHSTSAITYCSELSHQLDNYSLEQQKNIYIGLAELLLTKDNEWRKRLTKNEGFISASDSKNSEHKLFFATMKNRMQELLILFAEFQDFKQNLQAVRLLPPLTYTEQQWQILTALLELLPILVAQLHVLFQEREAVDYIEVAQSALTALGEPHSPTDLALSLDYQIQHILVDEFQDTSTSQYRLLEQLTTGWQAGDGRTLFLVGDPMQSIYRFRKAEVGLFLQAREHGIGHIKLVPLTLRINFRSLPKIVDWVNLTFQSLMPEQADIGTGAVTFNASAAHSVDHENGSVILHGLIDSAEASTEAHHIAQLIQQTLTQNPEQRIAILVRARSHLLEILPVLQAEKIAYRAIEIETLGQSAVIQDLLALTRALLHPADRIAWLAILRAPWCGLTLTELHQLVGADHTLTVWEQLLAMTTGNFTDATQQNLSRVIAVLNQCLKQRRRLSLASWVYGTWLALGGPASLNSEDDLADTKIFFNLIQTVQISEDLTDPLELEKQIASFYSAANAPADAKVDVMTIHKSKGLEFDTVILPGLNRALPADKQHLLFCMERPTADGETDLLLAPIKASMDEQDAIYHYLHSEEVKRANFEIARLLYVATTRAKKSLHLLATFSQENLQDNKIKSPAKNSLLAQLWPILGETFLTSANTQTESTYLGENHLEDDCLLRRFSPTWQLPAIAENLKPEFNSQIEQIAREKNNYYNWSYNCQRQIGTVVHNILRQMSLADLNLWDSKKITGQRLQFCSLLTRLGVINSELDSCLDTIEKSLQQIISDPKGRWILNHQHQEAYSEYPLSMVIDNEAKHYIIDRTFIDENNTRWVIDYKIVENFDEPLDNFLAGQVKHYRSQLEQYAKILQLQDPRRPIRLGLYFPLLQAWREWSYGE